MTAPTPNYGPDVQLKLLSRKMVHSLNNKLSVISSYAQLLKEALVDEEALLNLQEIEVAAKQCQEITQDWRAEADKIVPDPDEKNDTL